MLGRGKAAAGLAEPGFAGHFGAVRTRWACGFVTSLSPLAAVSGAFSAHGSSTRF